MKKRIFIFGHYGEKNTGDDAMIYVLLTELHKIYPLANFSIISPRKLFVPPQTKDKIKIIKPSPIPVLREIMSSSIFIMGGGTQIYDYGRRLERLKVLSQIFVLILWAKIFCKNVYFMNIGVEPFRTNIRKLLSKKICQMADFISVRDNHSYNVLKSIGIKKVKKSFDLAVLLDYPHKSKNNENNVIGLSILPFYEIYHDKKNLDHLMVNEISNTINEWLKYSSKNKIHLFIFKGKSRSDDYEITHNLKEKIDNEEQVKIIHYNPNPLITLSEINKCNIFIGMRYHSCLFAYITKTPMIIIKYFHKCSALADAIELPNQAVISLEEILNGKFKNYLLDILKNKYNYIGNLPVTVSKKRAKICFKKKRR